MVYLVFILLVAVVALAIGFSKQNVKLRGERVKAGAGREIAYVSLTAHQEGRRLKQTEKRLIENLKAKL